METTIGDTGGTDAAAVRITSAGHAAFAAAMIALGVIGFVTGDFAQIWAPVPSWVPARVPLAYLCAAISLATGIGMLFRRVAVASTRTLFVALLVWFAALRLPFLFFEKPVLLVVWTAGSTAVMLAAAWALCVRLETQRDASRHGIMGPLGLRMARALYGLALIPFGLAHFVYLDATTVLIPSWLPWHTAWAYFTGATFIAAGLAAIVGVLARVAISLSALQMALLTLIVWVPRMLTGTVTAFQRGEFIASCVLSAAAWVMAENVS